MSDRPTVKIALLTAAAAAFLGYWAVGLVHPAAPAFVHPAPAPPAAAAPLLIERFASRLDTAEVHAATAYSHRPGGLTAFWYGGSREGASDVAIYRSRFEGALWDEPRMVVGREQMKSDLNRHIRKLGNSIVYRHPDGRLWLFVVTVSVGGWAGSSISLLESVDDGRHWSPARRLVTSPFFNLSTLVKGSAFRYQDGTVGLPVYHEFIGKFAELLRLDASGRVIEKTRLTSGRHALQPEIAVISKDEAVGLLRYAGPPPRRALRTVTEDAGRTWSLPKKIDLPNPDSAIDVLALPDGRMLAVLNDLEDARWRLVLALSANRGIDWRTIKVLEQQQDAAEPKRHEFSYPWLLRSEDDAFHLLYTWDRKRIKHVEFNRGWLEQAIAAPQPEPPSRALAE